MPSEWRAALLPLVLVAIAYLLSYSPPFRQAHNGLFIAAIALCSYWHGTASGILAFLLSLFVITSVLVPWWQNRLMDFFSFSFASAVILWLEHRLRAAVSRERAERRFDRDAALDRIALLAHGANDSVTAVLAEAQMALEHNSNTGARLWKNGMRAVDLLTDIKHEVEELKRR